MSNQTAAQQHSTDAASTSPLAQFARDPNFETYPFEVVQHLIDQSGYFHMYSMPDPNRSYSSSLGSRNGVTGFEIDQMLRRFFVATQPPTFETGLKSVKAVG